MLDFIGAIFSLCATYYFIKLNPRAWVVSLCACVFNGVLYWRSGIFADMSLEIVYFISTLYGLYRWTSNQSFQKSHITRFNFKQNFYTALAVLGLYGVIFMILNHFTQSTVKHMDALTTALSLVGQGLMCFKVLSTWGVWLITDTLYIGLYAKKGLPFHVGLMGIYTILAITGYRQWRKALNIQANAPDFLPNQSPTTPHPDKSRCLPD